MDDELPEIVTFHLIPPARRALDEAVQLSRSDRTVITNRALQMYAFLLMERSVGHRLALLQRTEDRINIYEIRFNDDPDFDEFTEQAERERKTQTRSKELKHKLWKKILYVLGRWP